MNETTRNAPADSKRLRADYRDAFHNWAQQVSELRGAGTGADDPAAVDAAQHRAEAAETVYRESRNRLSEEMSHPDRR